MWNQKPSYPPKDMPAPMAPTPTPEPPAEAPRVQKSIAARVTALPPQEVSVIGKSITITGDITGSEPLHVEGRVKGSIRFEGAYLNIGPEATVQSSITAREVVVRGSINGNVNVSERIDIRCGGSLSGDVTAHSVSIEEGAYFKGSIDMRRTEAARQATQPVPAKVVTPAKPVEQEQPQAAMV
jgi:cytoskeletal protein CcmA (bactofilin family)